MNGEPPRAQTTPAIPEELQRQIEAHAVNHPNGAQVTLDMKDGRVNFARFMWVWRPTKELT